MSYIERLRGLLRFCDPDIDVILLTFRQPVQGKDDAVVQVKSNRKDEIDVEHDESVKLLNVEDDEEENFDKAPDNERIGKPEVFCCRDEVSPVCLDYWTLLFQIPKRSHGSINDNN